LANNMLIVLAALKYIGAVLAFSFFTLSVASGLYYLSELVEEHSIFAKRSLERIIYAVLGVHVLLLVVDRQPFWLTVFSFLAHVVYRLNLRAFPFIQLQSPIFLASCVLVVVNHYLWFQHFSHPPRPSYDYNYRSQQRPPPVVDFPSFGEISAFFGICVWLVPFSLFVSLSAGENVLPSSTADPGHHQQQQQQHRKGPGLVKQMVDGILAWIQSTSDLLGIGGSSQARYAA